MDKNLYLLDGTNLLYRAFFAVRMLNSPSGQPTNAVYGLATMLMKLIEDYKPDGIAVAFDKGRKTFRNEIYAEYKGTRQETPVELREQFEMAKELIRAFGIPLLESDDYEADDIIGTLAHRSLENNWKARIVSGDKDLLQLIDENVLMLLVRKGMTDLEAIDIPAFEEIYGVSPTVFVDVKALMGDSSDNIPGVPGVGEKTALKLIQEYGTLQGVYDHIDEISGKKLKENLVTHEETAWLSRRLSEICRTMPLDTEWESFRYEPDWVKIRGIFEQCGFKSLLKKLPTTFGTGGENTGHQTFSGELSYEKVLPKGWGEEVRRECSEDQPLMIVPVYRDQFPRERWGGIGICWKERCYFLSRDHCDWGQAIRFLQDEKITKVTWESKSIYRSANSYEMDLKGIFLDVKIGAYLLHPGEGGLDEISIWENFGEGVIPPKPETEEELAVWFALFAGKTYPKIRAELLKASQWELFKNMESSLAEVLAELEWNGIQVDAGKMAELSEEFSKRLQESVKIIYEAAGEPFNINSPKQLGMILFEKLQLPVLKKTKTGPSTDVEVLEELAPFHPMVKELLNYRHLTKLKSTYLDALPLLINPVTGRIHTTFHQTVTATGRLSSANPNLQNIPVRSDEGKKIRYFFVPGREFQGLLSADYSQIELRILAHMAGDESMKEAFSNGEDIHTRTAAEVFGVLPGDVTREMRSHAKAVNFGIIYGISDYSLSKDIGVTRKEAGEYMERYFARYPKIKATIEGLVELGREHGYSETMDGRRRYIPDIKSSNFNRRSFAERIAMNMPIQGTAADVIKKAMIQIYEDLKIQGFRSQMVLQVHDELVFEYVEEELEALRSVVVARMEGAMSLSVPLRVDVAVGPNWAEAK